MKASKLLGPVLAALFYSVQIPVSLSAADTCDYEKMFGREDRTRFGRECALCHSMGGPWEKPGGPLNGLFTRKQLLTGEPVTEEAVRKKIAEGGPGMPGFQHTLTAAQIRELVQYLKDANCPQDDSLEKAKALQKSRNSPSEPTRRGEANVTD